MKESAVELSRASLSRFLCKPVDLVLVDASGEPRRAQATAADETSRTITDGTDSWHSPSGMAPPRLHQARSEAAIWTRAEVPAICQ